MPEPENSFSLTPGYTAAVDPVLLAHVANGIMTALEANAELEDNDVIRLLLLAVADGVDAFNLEIADLFEP